MAREADIAAARLRTGSSGLGAQQLRKVGDGGELKGPLRLLLCADRESLSVGSERECAWSGEAAAAVYGDNLTCHVVSSLRQEQDSLGDVTRIAPAPQRHPLKATLS